MPDETSIQRHGQQFGAPIAEITELAGRLPKCIRKAKDAGEDSVLIESAMAVRRSVEGDSRNRGSQFLAIFETLGNDLDLTGSFLKIQLQPQTKEGVQLKQLIFDLNAGLLKLKAMVDATPTEIMETVKRRVVERFGSKTERQRYELPRDQAGPRHEREPRQIDKLKAAEDRLSSVGIYGFLAVLLAIAICFKWPTWIIPVAVILGAGVGLRLLLIKHNEHLKDLVVREISNCGIKLRTEYFFVFPQACTQCGGRDLKIWEWWREGRPPLRRDARGISLDVNAPKNEIHICRKCRAIRRPGGTWQTMTETGVMASLGVFR
jgi:hypothetical protein